MRLLSFLVYLMRFFTLSFLAFVACHAAMAAPLPPRVQSEVDGLMTRLEVSGCEFNRNGSWYSAVEARKHLSRKLEYLKDKTSVTSTEQFIDMAASSSSVSGKPYLVRCNGASPMPSRSWLLSQLGTVRTRVTSSAPGK